VARELGAPLDVLIVRKIGAPQHPEYAIGALVRRGSFWLRLPNTGGAERAAARPARRRRSQKHPPPHPHTTTPAEPNRARAGSM